MSRLLLVLWLAACNGDVAITKAPVDDDNDGFNVDVDCDDSHATVNPDAPEICDGLDNDCNESVDDEPTDGNTYYADADGDSFGDAATTVIACAAPAGYVEDSTDCNDAEAAMFPGNPEICDGLDNDCNSKVDDQPTDLITVYVDGDGDGYGDDATASQACAAASGESEKGGDCDDSNGAIHPNATENDCTDPVDYNCDGSVGYTDADGDKSPACQDCNDANSAINPSAAEICNDLDDDCDGDIDDDDSNLTGAPTWYRDPDSDGYTSGTGLSLTQCDAPTGYASASGDCDDYDGTVNPGAAEICDALNVDEDCDGVADDKDPSTDAATWLNWYRDLDGDSYGDSARVVSQCEAPSAAYVGTAGDCDDANAAINPGATEICNIADDDCDGLTDDADSSLSGATTWYTDGDGDGYGGASKVACTKPAKGVATGGDCDDAVAAVNPGATEICDAANTDEDCDGLADDDDSSASGRKTWYKDADGDNYGTSTSVTVCDAPSGYTLTNGDCNDAAAGINPGAQEVCDSADVDEDCDGLADDADSSASGKSTWYADSDGDGYGSKTGVSVCDPGSTYIKTSGDCDDTNGNVNPAAIEVCDALNVDEDCDGLADDADGGVAGKVTWYRDLDGYLQGSTTASLTSCDQPSGYIATTGDCDDSRATIYLNAPELCDGYDNDCDGSVDENASATWYRDADGDGYGSTSSTTSCTQPSGYVANNTDCNDNSAAANPGATEICDSVDNDCDSSIDEGLFSTWYQDSDKDTYGNSAVSVSACSQPSGYVAISTDCNDGNSAINPGATEICDSVDNDCDSSIDEGVLLTWYRDADADNYGTTSPTTTSCTKPAGYASTSTDCNDSNVAINPGATEVCDASNTDEDCDGLADNLDSSATGKSTYYYDGDKDNYGGSTSQTVCDASSGYIATGNDCDDTVAATNPGATEVCSDSIDNNCNGTVDEGCATRILTGSLSTSDYDTKIYGNEQYDAFGYAVAAGDFNGDGKNDLVVGAPDDEYSATYSAYGAAYVYSGALASGVSVSTANDTALLYTTSSSYVDFGIRLWAFPDLNSDGKEELGVGGALSTTGLSTRVFMYRGSSLSGSLNYSSAYLYSYFCSDMSSAGDFYTGASQYLACGYVNSSTSTGVVYVYADTSTTALVTLNGETASDHAGVSVDLAHDLNGDGTNDALVGADGNDAGGSAAGAAYVVYGPITGSYNLSGYDMRVTGATASDYLGYQVAAGDLDGDGDDDLILGAYGYDYGTRASSGAVYLFTSKYSGSKSASTANAVIYGEAASNYLGYSTLSTGDVDGDGKTDLLLSSSYNDSAATDAGATWLLYGTISASYDLLYSYDARWRGEGTSYYSGFESIITGDTNGDGADDVAIGGYNADERGYTEHGAVWLMLGG